MYKDFDIWLKITLKRVYLLQLSIIYKVISEEQFWNKHHIGHLFVEFNEVQHNFHGKVSKIFLRINHINKIWQFFQMVLKCCCNYKSCNAFNILRVLITLQFLGDSVMLLWHLFDHYDSDKKDASFHKFSDISLGFLYVFCDVMVFYSLINRKFLMLIFWLIWSFVETMWFSVWLALYVFFMESIDDRFGITEVEKEIG